MSEAKPVETEEWDAAVTEYLLTPASDSTAREKLLRVIRADQRLRKDGAYPPTSRKE